MQNHLLEARAIRDHLDAAQSILIISHQSPDGDTLGSGNAMIEYLLRQGKKVTAFCLDPLPAYLHYLPHNHYYTSSYGVFAHTYDAVVVVDSGSLEYAGVKDLIPILPNNPTLINIDHHQTNPLYGQQNIVITQASSTCEVIARLFHHWEVILDRSLAQCLLTGIITDTSGLKNPATNHLTIGVVSKLIRAGADIQDIYRKTHHQKSINQLRLWGLALSRLKMNKKHRIASTYIRHEDLDEHGVTGESLEGIANYLAVLSDARVILVLKTEPGIVRGSFRTPFNKPDLSRLAQTLGGGGHKKAAGFLLPGELITEGTTWKII